MNPVQAILQDYQNGGEEQRLNLFLTHRDLRPVFMTMEQPVGKPRLAGKNLARPGLKKQLRSMFHGWCGAFGLK